MWKWATWAPSVGWQASPAVQPPPIHATLMPDHRHQLMVGERAWPITLCQHSTSQGRERSNTHGLEIYYVCPSASRETPKTAKRTMGLDIVHGRHCRPAMCCCCPWSLCWDALLRFPLRHLNTRTSRCTNDWLPHPARLSMFHQDFVVGDFFCVFSFGICSVASIPAWPHVPTLDPSGNLCGDIVPLYLEHNDSL